MNDSVFNKSLIYFFPVLILIFLLQVFHIYNLYTPWIFALYYVGCGIFCYKKIYKESLFKTVITLWIIYITLSGAFAGLPLSYTTEEFKRFIAPVFFTFVGMYSVNDKFNKVFLYTIFFSIIIGFFLITFRPSWYVYFLIECFNNAWYSQSTESAGSIMTTAYRFQSFYPDSYAISYFASFSLCLVVCDIYKVNRLIKNNRILYLMLLAYVVAIFLSGFRVALVYMFLIFCVMMIFGIITNNPRKKILVSTIIGVFVVVTLFMFFLSDNSYISYLSNTLYERFSDLSYDHVMEGSRDTQQDKVLESWQNIVWGDGTGSKGAQARIDGRPAITDGGYIKMLVENGIVGITIFSLIILATIKRGLSNVRYYLSELLIIGYVLASMLGANSLAMNWCYMIPFWYSVGSIWNKNLLINRKNNQEII